MKRGVSDRCKVQQDNVSVRLLERKGSVNCSGCTTRASFGPQKRKDSCPSGAAGSPCARRTEAGESFEKRLRPSGIVQIFASPGSHAGNNVDRLRHLAVGEDRDLLGSGAD